MPALLRTRTKRDHETPARLMRDSYLVLILDANGKPGHIFHCADRSGFIAVELLEQLVGLVEAAHHIGGATGVGMVALGLLPVGLADLG